MESKSETNNVMDASSILKTPNTKGVKKPVLEAVEVKKKKAKERGREKAEAAALKKRKAEEKVEKVESRKRIAEEKTSAKASKKKHPTQIVEDVDKYEAKCITDIFEKRELLDVNFKKCVTGYHLINETVIKETMWESINSQILESSGIKVYSKSDGGHKSGMDIDCSLGKFSNKSSIYSKNKKECKMSSYRLTEVCSGKKCGTPIEIIEEINKRKNFDYYSFIVRCDEKNKETISYDWLIIPNDYSVLDPSSYIWEPTIGKKGKNKDTQIGWNTNKINGCKMSIRFSMSSQLWIDIEMTDMEKFIIASAVVNNKPKFNYIQLGDILSNHPSGM